MSASDKNLSTEHQPKGSAHNLSDTLDRQGEQVPAGQRQWADDSATPPADPPNVRGGPTDDVQNAGARRGGEAAGGIEPQPGDPTDPAKAAARARGRDEAMKDSGFGDDGARSTYRS